MAENQQAPRRVRIERNIYRRATGVYEVGFKDVSGKQRWRTVDGGIQAARAVRDELLSQRSRGERVVNNGRLRFGDAADQWLGGPVVDLRPATRACYRNAVEHHLRHRFGARRLDAIGPDDLADAVRELRGQGLAESTIVIVVGVTNRIYRYAARRLDWAGVNPVSLMLSSERPKPSQDKRRRVFERGELEQTLAAADEPYRTLFTVAALTGARLSELLALRWADVRIDDAEDAEIEFALQVDRHGNLAPTKTDGSARTVPIPTQLARILVEHRHRSTFISADDFVFTTRSGRPFGQRSASATSPGRCALPSSRRSARMVTRRSRSSTSQTGMGSGFTCLMAHSHRCTAFAAPSPAGHCWRARAWMRSRSCSDTAMPM